MLRVIAVLAVFLSCISAFAEKTAEELAFDIPRKPEETSDLVRRIGAVDFGPLADVAAKVKAGKRITAPEKTLLVQMASRYRVGIQRSRMWNRSYLLKLICDIIRVQKGIVDVHRQNLTARIDLIQILSPGDDPQINSLLATDKLRLQDTERFSKALDACLIYLAPKRKPT